MAQMIEIICIGEELLMDKMLNINAYWLAKRATTLGFKVSRIVTVTDNVNEISTRAKNAC
jgi:molybdopterin-biosynthesis enzyme MoeA-like protein